MGLLIGSALALAAQAQSPYNDENIVREPQTNASDQPLPKENPPAPSPSRPRISNNSLPTAYSGRHYSKEEVIQLIKDYSALYGINPDLPLRIAKCESGYNHLAKNPSSTASGVFQYLSSTWKATDQGKLGLSVFDADPNVKAAISYIASRGHAQPWNASKHCWAT